jgi:hypothetical protein
MGGENASRDVTEGAETPVWLSTAPFEEIGYNGYFFRDKKKREF